MNVIIVEDEALARERLCSLINECDPTIEVAEEFDTIEDTVDYFKTGAKPDLAFFDIKLSDGLSFEVFNQVNTNVPVVFTTAFDDFAIKAFKLNSIDYLLKPIDKNDLQFALDKHKNLKQLNTSNSVNNELLNNLLKNIDKSYKKRFLVKFGDKIQFKEVNETAFIYADGKTAYLVPVGSSRKYIIDHTLDELEQHILDPDRFFRINRKVIVRLEAIKEIRSYINSRLKIDIEAPTDLELIVSRERVTSFKNWINQ